jgi:hypothetical protein
VRHELRTAVTKIIAIAARNNLSSVSQEHLLVTHTLAPVPDPSHTQVFFIFFIIFSLWKKKICLRHSRNESGVEGGTNEWLKNTFWSTVLYRRFVTQM